MEPHWIYNLKQISTEDIILFKGAIRYAKADLVGY